MEVFALVLALACGALTAARAQDDAVERLSDPGPVQDAGFAPTGFDESPDLAFEPHEFRLFASNAGYGMGRDTGVTLSSHGRVVSLAPYVLAFALGTNFWFADAPYQVAAAVEDFASPR